MKNSLHKRNETRESHKLFHADSLISCKKLSNAWSLNKQITKWLFISVIMITLSFSTAYAQTIESVDNYKKKISKAESQHFNDLIKGSSSTLFIYGNEFRIKENTSPVIAAVALESLDQIYSTNAKFENIELIRIKVKNTNDLEYKIDLEKLSHFQKLKYIYVVITFDICTENPDDVDCQISEIRKMISFSTKTTNPVVLIQRVILM